MLSAIYYSVIISVSMLFIIILYHLFLFFTRIKFKGERYNLYFSMATFFSLIYVIYSVFFNGQEILGKIHRNFSPVITVLIIITSSFFYIRLIFSLLNLTSKEKKMYRLTFMLLYLGVLNGVSSVVFGFDFYNSNTRFFMIPLVGGGMFFLVGYTYFLVLSKKIISDKTVKYLTFGFGVMLINFIFEKIFVILKIENVFIKNNYIMLPFQSLLFSYALIQKFNKEHLELDLLKKNLEMKVEERTKELKAEKDKRVEFFLNIAHETKNPLSNIKNYLDQYIAENDNDHTLLIIKKHINKICTDLNNFLDIEKIHRQQMNYNNDQISNFSSILKDKIELFQATIKKQGKVFKLCIEEDVYVLADPYAIDRIVNNIIENAIKYSSDNSFIDISLAVNREEVIFSVVNNGDGISEKYIDVIFNPFYQIESKKSNRQGFGLGLSIVKHAVEELDGEIYFNSTENHDTTFFVKLKRYDLNNSDKIAFYKSQDTTFSVFLNREITEKQFIENRPSILVVEDDYDLLVSITNSLYNNNFNIFYAFNGKEAKNILDKNIPDLIISDLMMDEMDGIELLKYIKESDEFCYIPFIFLTAKKEEESIKNALRFGAIEYIHKPFDMENLIFRVKNILNYKVVEDENIKNRIILTMRDKIENKFKEYDLTKTEKEVILLAVENYSDTNYDLAKKMCDNGVIVTHKTVGTHIRNVGKKIDKYGKKEIISFFK